jgi:hypothetical protein
VLTTGCIDSIIRFTAGALINCERVPVRWARIFAAGAVVEDEGQTHTGIDAVREWKRETENRFTFTIDPLGRFTYLEYDATRNRTIQRLQNSRDFYGVASRRAIS